MNEAITEANSESNQPWGIQYYKEIDHKDLNRTAVQLNCSSAVFFYPLPITTNKPNTTKTRFQNYLRVAIA